MSKKNILVVVEGEKKDVAITEMMFAVYDLDVKYNIVTYKTNLYALYNQLFIENAPEDIDLIQLLKQNEKDDDKKQILDNKYTDILLLFDFDPHDSNYSEDKIKNLQTHFCESTDMGKLYIHYPMVEAFYHMKSDDERSYDLLRCSMANLVNGEYKHIVDIDTAGKIYNLLLKDKDVFKKISASNIEKIYLYITDRKKEVKHIVQDGFEFDPMEILTKQIDSLKTEKSIHVFSTLGLFIYDYNPIYLLN